MLARMYHRRVALIGLVWAVGLGLGLGLGLGFGTVASMLELFEIEVMRGALVVAVTMRMDYIGRFVYDTGE